MFFKLRRLDILQVMWMEARFDPSLRTLTNQSWKTHVNPTYASKCHVLASSTKSLPKKNWGEKIQQKLHFKNSLTASRAHPSFYSTTPCETVGFPPDVNRGLPIPWTGWRKKSLANLPLWGLQGNVLIAIIVEWVLSSPKSSMGNPRVSFICPI